MLYVASKEAFLYKQNSFSRAREVRPVVLSLLTRFQRYETHNAACSIPNSVIQP